MIETETSDRDLPLRHTLATLAYRAAKVLRDAPADFSVWRPGATSRSAGEILSHLSDLCDWALSLAQGDERWTTTAPGSWTEDSKRFFTALTALDQYLSSSAELHAPAGKLFQSAIADALTHVGQLGMMRRLAGAPVRGENYYVAEIGAGRTGSEQVPAAGEFD